MTRHWRKAATEFNSFLTRSSMLKANKLHTDTRKPSVDGKRKYLLNILPFLVSTCFFKSRCGTEWAPWKTPYKYDLCHFGQYHAKCAQNVQQIDEVAVLECGALAGGSCDTPANCTEVIILKPFLWLNSKKFNIQILLFL